MSVLEELIELIKTRDKDIEEIAEENERYFQIWTSIVDYIGQTKGKNEIVRIAKESIKNNDYLERLLHYIEDNFDEQRILDD